MSNLVHNDTADVDVAVKRDKHSQEFEARLKTIMAQIQPGTGKRIVHEMGNHLIECNKGHTIDRHAAVCLQIVVAANLVATWLCEAEDVSPIGDPAVDGRALAVERVFVELFRRSIQERKASAAVSRLGTKGNG